MPAGPVLDIGEMTEDPQTKAREMIMEVNHSKLGPVRTLGPPIKFAGTPSNVRRGAPVLGEHSEEILLEYGFTAEEIKAMGESGAVILG